MAGSSLVVLRGGVRPITLTMISFVIAGCAFLDHVPLSAREASEPLAVCTEGAPEPSSDQRFRPTQKLVCNYSASELNRRILSLLRVEPRSLSVEAVEAALGIRGLYTAFDDPRARGATYNAVVEAAPGSGEWRILLLFDESFFPLVAGRPARFRGTTRPTPIDSHNRGQIRLEIFWLGPSAATAGSPECLMVDEFSKAARTFGWRRGHLESSSTSHGGAIQRLTASREKATASVDVTVSRVCAYDFEIVREADKDEPPVTEEELQRNQTLGPR